jgi:oxygen-dependent protoporphyrinogen oxidase
VGGIYASDPDKLSLAATMPRFKEMEKSWRSIIYAMWSSQRQRAKNADFGSGARWSLFVTLAGGMEELVDSLAERLPPRTTRLNCAATELSQKSDRTWVIALGNAERIDADGVIIATPAFRAGALLRQIDASAAGELTAISYASTATVNLAYRRQDFPRAPNSFGFVVPAIEKRKIMACTFSSLKYPGRRPRIKSYCAPLSAAVCSLSYSAQATARWRTASAPNWRLCSAPPPHRYYAHLAPPRIDAAISCRPRRAGESHRSGAGKISTLALAGSAYHGVGIADCVHTGEAAAEKVFARVHCTS